MSDSEKGLVLHLFYIPGAIFVLRNFWQLNLLIYFLNFN